MHRWAFKGSASLSAGSQPFQIMLDLGPEDPDDRVAKERKALHESLASGPYIEAVAVRELIGAVCEEAAR